MGLLLTIPHLAYPKPPGTPAVGREHRPQRDRTAFNGGLASHCRRRLPRLDPLALNSFIPRKSASSTPSNAASDTPFRLASMRFQEKITPSDETTQLRDASAPCGSWFVLAAIELRLPARSDDATPWRIGLSLGRRREIKRAEDKNVPPHPTHSPANLAARGGGEEANKSAARLI